MKRPPLTLASPNRGGGSEADGEVPLTLTLASPNRGGGSEADGEVALDPDLLIFVCKFYFWLRS